MSTDPSSSEGEGEAKKRSEVFFVDGRSLRQRADPSLVRKIAKIFLQGLYIENVKLSLIPQSDTGRARLLKMDIFPVTRPKNACL